MLFLFMNSLISQELVHAFCWTLIHSLWEGLILSVIAGIAILCTRKSSPFLRYNLLSLLFFSFLIFCGLTFFLEMNLSVHLAAVQGARENLEPVLPSFTVPESGFTSATPPASLLNSLAEYFNLHASLVVTLWFIIFMARFIRVMANLGFVQRVRHYRTHAPASGWKDKITELATRLGIRRSVGLLESELVKVPMMLGLLKPLILVPFGLLAQLPPDQVEAILLHELAHIKRRDYAINLLQSFAETIFFFNPAVWWVSSLIREEREHCCDEMAIGKTKGKKEFIHALVAFQEYQQSFPHFGIGFFKNKNHLLDRVRRIVTRENKSLNNMEKIFLASAIVLAGFISLSYSQATTAKDKKPQDSSQVSESRVISGNQQTIRDTVPDKKGKTISVWIFQKDMNGKQYKVVEKNNKLTELTIDGRPVPANELSGYEPLIDNLFSNEKENLEQSRRQEMELNREQAIMARKQDEMARELREKMGENQLGGNQFSERTYQDLLKDGDDPLKMKEAELQLQLLRKQQELIQQNGSELRNDQEKYNQMLEVQQRQIELLKKELEKKGSSQEDILKLLSDPALHDAAIGDPNSLEEQLKIGMRQEDALKRMLMEERRRSELQSLGGAVDETTLGYLHRAEAAAQIPEQGELPGLGNPAWGMEKPLSGISAIIPSKITLLIIKDLMNEKIVTGDQQISFSLNSKELIVNGVKQSAELLAKLKEKYIKGPNDHVIYSHSGSKSGNSSHEDIYTDKQKSNLEYQDKR
jgi:bla regulator protein blaR1